jgi:hypothetical protein
MGDFWEDMSGAYLGNSTSLNDFLEGTPFDGDQFKSVRQLADLYKKSGAIPLPQAAGTRVKFKANLNSVLSYADVPEPSVEGTVVTVKTAEGPKTDLDGRVFVSWDDGKFRPIFAEHLKLSSSNKKRAMSVKMHVSNLGDLSSMFTVLGSSSDELVHKATQDLWSVRKDGEGYSIERLFDDTGKPLKV